MVIEVGMVHGGLAAFVYMGLVSDYVWFQSPCLLITNGG